MKRGERGANLVELAIVTPVLLLLIAGIADLGRAYHHYVIITNAAREGARLGARLPCRLDNATQRAAYAAAITDAVIDEAASSGVDLGGAGAAITISPNPASGCAAVGGPIIVTVSLDYDMLLGNLLGIASLTLQNDASMAFFGND